MNLLYEFTFAEEEQLLVLTLSDRNLQLDWQGKSLCLRRSKAAIYLAELLLHPYQPVTAMALYTLVNCEPPRLSSAAQLGLDESCVGDSLHRLPRPPLCDAETVRSIKHRLVRILAQLAEAEEWQDLARREELQQERDKLLAYLRTSLSRKLESELNRDLDYKCRDNVYQSLRQLLSRIGKSFPELGTLLSDSLQLWGRLTFVPPPQLSVIVREAKT